VPIRALHQFPRRFLWGAATAAQQVEGQNTNDWWRWEQFPRHIAGDQHAGRAADWWAGRYLEDFDRAAGLNNNALRLSIEWSRIEPEPGIWDEWALSRYRDMVLALCDRGITPLITLHHYTSPLWIADRDGWLSDDTPACFERFVRKVVEALRDQCMLWCTVNEPATLIDDGYRLGAWPPGLRRGRAADHAAVNLVSGHVRAYHAIRERQPAAMVGYTAAIERGDTFFDSAVLEGQIRLSRFKTIAVPEAKGAFDWVGLQAYPRLGPRHSPASSPAAVVRAVERHFHRHGKPVYLTEIGIQEGEDRPAYMIDLLRGLWDSANGNRPVRGFFVRSLIDGFEWSQGYGARFGLFSVDFASQERTPTTSASLYREIGARNGLSAEMVETYAPELMAKMFPGEAGKNNVLLKPRARA